MDRRDFLARAGIVATWAGIAVTVGCGEDGDSGMEPDTDPGSIAGTVTGSDHPHAVSITDAQVTAAQAVTLTLSGSGHSHTVTLTAEQVTMIGNDTSVTVTSTSSSGHIHTVTFL